MSTSDESLFDLTTVGSIVEGESGFGEVVENMEAVITVIPVVRPLYFYIREGVPRKSG